jgi:hypothetical protein
VPRGAALLSALTFGSYLVGLLRDRIFARTFGAGVELDAYNAAFVLPELTLDVLVASGLAAPFIPIFVRLGTDDEREAHAFAQTILTGAIVLMTVAAVVLFVFAPQTTDLIAPSFEGAQRDRYVDLFRVMLVTPILFAASLTLGEVLLVERRWISYGIAPLAYNAGSCSARSPSAGRLASSARRSGPSSAPSCTSASGSGACGLRGSRSGFGCGSGRTGSTSSSASCSRRWRPTPSSRSPSSSSPRSPVASPRAASPRSASRGISRAFR